MEWIPEYDEDEDLLELFEIISMSCKKITSI
jgi:hypothetical protein